MNYAHIHLDKVLGLAASLLFVCALSMVADAARVIERGPHEAVWESPRQVFDPAVGWVTETNVYTELATGLDYWNPRTEAWEETVEAFELLPGGYADRHRERQLGRLGRFGDARRQPDAQQSNGVELFLH